MTTRRQFIHILPVAAAALSLSRTAQAQGALLDEKSPQAAALGYVADAARTDKARFPRYAAPQACVNCTLYQGKATDAAGGCPLFPGKQVTAKGWCSAYAKKA